MLAFMMRRVAGACRGHGAYYPVAGLVRTRSLRKRLCALGIRISVVRMRAEGADQRNHSGPTGACGFAQYLGDACEAGWVFECTRPPALIFALRAR